MCLFPAYYCLLVDICKPTGNKYISDDQNYLSFKQNEKVRSTNEWRKIFQNGTEQDREENVAGEHGR